MLYSVFYSARARDNQNNNYNKAGRSNLFGKRSRKSITGNRYEKKKQPVSSPIRDGKPQKL